MLGEFPIPAMCPNDVALGGTDIKTAVATSARHSAQRKSFSAAASGGNLRNAVAVRRPEPLLPLERDSSMILPSSRRTIFDRRPRTIDRRRHGASFATSTGDIPR